MLDQDLTCWQDPCRTQLRISIRRFGVYALLVLAAFVGTPIFLILLEDRPYGIQLISILGYTLVVPIYTLRSGPFLLSCPVVHGQLPRLIRRHLGFLAVLFIGQTTALKLRPNLPAYLITTRGTDPSLFAVILGIFCLCLALVQIFSTRWLLNRAHLSAQANAA